MQYTKGDWRNRNKIKSPNGDVWLTVPCGSNLNRLIHEVELTNPSWQKKHFKSIVQNYQKAPFFMDYKNLIEEIYLDNKWTNLSDFNQFVTKKISKDILGFKTKFSDSREFNLSDDKQIRLIELLNQTNSDVYLSGPSAKDYINESLFNDNGINVEWMDYSNYPEYEQIHPEFSHGLSILDLIFNQGKNSLDYMKSRGQLTSK